MCSTVLFMLLLLVPRTVQAQGEAAVPFLLISPAPRASALGESGAGIADDASAMFYNPAGLAFQHGYEISLSHSSWLPQLNLSDLFYENLYFKAEMPSIDGTIGASIIFMNYGEFNRTLESGPDVVSTFRSFEMAAAVGYSTLITEDLSIGTNLRFIYSKLADVGTGQEQGKGIASTVSADIAMLYKPQVLEVPLIGDIGNAFSAGFNLSNLGPTMTYIDKDQADPIPTNIRIGLGYKILDLEHNNLNLSVDFSRLLVRRYPASEGKKPDPFYKALFTSWGDGGLRRVVAGVGLEYWYDKTVALRAGYFHEDEKYGNRKFLTFGGGIRYDIYGFDFSYISATESSPLANTLRFSILVNWQ
jgi:long-subunit fatty acid transport protein